MKDPATSLEMLIVSIIFVALIVGTAWAAGLFAI
jgi:hypothetical protein